MHEPAARVVVSASCVSAVFLLYAWPSGFLPQHSVPVGEYALLLVCLAAASVHDLRTRIIPNSYALACMSMHVVVLAACVAANGHEAAGACCQSAAGFLLLGVGSLVFALAFQRITGTSGMGGGDIKLLAAIGFILGPSLGLQALLLACAIFCLQVMMQSALHRMSVRIGSGSDTAMSWVRESHAFVPALALGAFLVVIA